MSDIQSNTVNNSSQDDLGSLIAETQQSPHAQHQAISAKNRIDPLADTISSVELIKVSGSDLDIVNAARVSHGKIASSITERDKKLIAFLVQYHHTSPFEHTHISYRIKAPIYVVRQWMRHRMNSYNEISYRYVESDLEFYTPAFWRYQDKANHQSSTGKFHDEALLQTYKQTLTSIAQAYKSLLQQGVAREIARGLLPLCTYTEFIFSCNLHSLVNFLKLRLAQDTQYETRVYAQALFEFAQPYFPVSFDAWAKKYNW